MAVMQFDCSRCTGYVGVQGNGAEPLLVNAIDAYAGKVWINLDGDSRTTQLVVKATGSWTMKVGSLDELATHASSADIHGKGDDVVVISGAATQAKLTNEGTGVFEVEVAGDEGWDMPVMHVGSYSGTVPMSLPGVVQIKSGGTWMISPGS